MIHDVLNFWFSEISPAQWWAKDAQFDQLIRVRFGALHDQAARFDLFTWRNTAQGRLAEILILDQFSRNLYRDTPQAFAQDALALALAQEAIAAGAPQQLTAPQRNFLYLPFMHSESREIHAVAVALYESNGEKTNLDFELQHRAIIDRFGRYPHRNAILGRVSSVEESEFLQTEHAGF